ncbi:heavy metal-associated isoprenylated plant protein 3 [Artemisia annua]|uniref:Heavy metal-associated isoprenylated plant protein 3 n=1 Tax=Artemisia annua TaxID=35608 RepID=A0A2U1NPB4_ARTAN|nr:heavy metal-associated isoprenylated plant protein 3 [Artemisia annua]
MKHSEILENCAGVKLGSQTRKCNAMKAIRGPEGIESIVADTKGGRLIVIWEVDPVRVASCARKIEMAEITTVGPAYNRVDKLSKLHQCVP